MNSLFPIIGVVVGIVIGYIIRKLIFEKDNIKISDFNQLNESKTRLEIEIDHLNTEKGKLNSEISDKNIQISELQKSESTLKVQHAELVSDFKNQKEELAKLFERSTNLDHKIETQEKRIQDLNEEKAVLNANLESKTKSFNELTENSETQKEEIRTLTNHLFKLRQQATEFEEKNKGLTEKLESQKKEIEEIGQKFTNEFKVLADKILDEKSKKFTEQNQVNIKNILDPLGKNIDEFKKKVEETYDKESKQRFSLEEKIKELAGLNKKISEEAKNLTQALKGSAKKQGDWGEMILERILENSGLTKDREYFVQEFLKDDSGNIIKDETGKKMQPDVVIQYPDNRKIIVDSKVSLVAYERFSSADTKEEQDLHLIEHIKSIKSHIDNLSGKNYQNFTSTLDFVMLFVPIEPAYMVAIQGDPALWEYAYKKRILLISPTNLIASLKLIADLWQREYQNQNAIEIAERGGLLYDKFVSFVESLEDIGKNIDKSQKSYDSAMKQLNEGSGNLVGQVEKLKKLGVKAQKSIPSKLLDE